MARTYYDLFISHSWTYSDTYQGLLNLLNKDVAFPYRNYSVPKNDPLHTNGTDKQLLDAIREQVRQSSCVLICAGVYATYSKWIDKEIQVAVNEYAKPVIGIKPWENVNVSAKVRDHATVVVAWRKDSIERAIRELVN